MTNRERMARWRKQQKEKGLCVICRQPVCSSSIIHCEECKAKQRNKQDQRKRDGLCRTCDKKSGPLSVVYCEACLMKTRKKARMAAARRPKKKIPFTIQRRYSTLKSKAKARGVYFNIEYTWFENWYKSIEKKCSYCGIDEASLLEKKNHKSCLTIDRRQNNCGYEPSNVCLACFRCNNMKSNFFTADEWKEIADRYIKPRIIEYHHR